ncbi:13914_t:CDS:2 [Gigaspora margarita]|uniref:13914_t:CDS:1 n=1 Tax=Gigaspora margarita TaxID=4874 RepID=A0ABM8W6A9_GIGMA|nr:13914_t:CDS:2 [Gigaspora margarita]
MSTQFTLSDACAIARERGGRCLSALYINCRVPLDWKCAKGHQWSALFCRIKNKKSWCLQCSRYGPHSSSYKYLTLEDAIVLAHSKNGECLSTKYINSKTPLHWRCDKGHRWFACLDSALALSRNGECLSSDYVNNKTPLQWKCDKGHIWSANLNKVKDYNQWCSTCAGFNRTIVDMQNLAQIKNGRCLSDKYYDAHTKLEWEYKKGHKWITEPNCILKCHWCPECSSTRKTLENMNNIAKERGGKCLSTAYVNTNTHLNWKCEKGHTWIAVPNNIIQGMWCPFCPWKRQELCRKIVTELLDTPPSEKHRPDFLKTDKHPTGLELDLPYYDFGFAIEVQGIQHKCFHPFFHKNQEEFEKQKERNQLKKDLCYENDIYLFYVWYDDKDPEKTIRDELWALGLID